MSPSFTGDFEDEEGVPRASGDEPATDISGDIASVCSPRERG